MKRMMALLLACAILLTGTLAFVAAAKETVTLTVGSAQGAVGDIVKIPVSISDGHYLVNGRIFLTYDPAVLELQQVSDDKEMPYIDGVNTAIFDNTFMWAFDSPEAGAVNFVFASSADEGVEDGGVLYTLTFKILQDPTGTAITVTIPEMCSNDGGVDYDTDLTLINGTVSLSSPTTGGGDVPGGRLGDVDRDGTVALADALQLFYAVNGKLTLTTEQLANADINGDGQITIADAIRLLYAVNDKITL